MELLSQIISQFRAHFEHRRSLSFPRKQTCITSKKADEDKITKILQHFHFLPICWTNPTLLVELWTVWLETIMSQCIPKKTMHRKTLPVWISPQSST